MNSLLPAFGGGGKRDFHKEIKEIKENTSEEIFWFSFLLSFFLIDLLDLFVKNLEGPSCAA